MANTGDLFRDAVIELVRSWNITGLEIYKEVFVGERFVGNRRNIDIVVKYREKSLGIETKYQNISGTAYQKLVYALEDCKTAPIPCILVFGGEAIRSDVKALLIRSGTGLEVRYDEKRNLIENSSILKQRILMDLGLDWLDDQKERKVN